MQTLHRIHQRLIDFQKQTQAYPARLSFSDTVNFVTLDVQHFDQLAGSYRQIDFSPRQPQQHPVRNLEKLAAELRGRLTYLSEPLRIVEYDRDESMLQMRSEKPLDDGARRTYFEFLLRPEQLSLTRYEVLPDGRRQPTLMALTHEIASRLIHDVDQLLARHGNPA